MTCRGKGREGNGQRQLLKSPEARPGQACGLSLALVGWPVQKIVPFFESFWQKRKSYVSDGT